MRLSFWGVRGSIPTPDADKLRYGGNTSCVNVHLDEGAEIILDAGTGIRRLGARLAGTQAPIHILLTHLHLDHMQGRAGRAQWRRSRRSKTRFWRGAGASRRTGPRPAFMLARA